MNIFHTYNNNKKKERKGFTKDRLYFVFSYLLMRTRTKQMLCELKYVQEKN